MFRLDRLLTLYLFHRLRRILPRSKGIRIPILMYHSISDEPESGHPYFWLNTSPKRFAEHMQFLRDNNYKVIDLSEAAKMISTESSGSPNLPTFHHSSIRQKMVVLTFDDGYRDFNTHAFPVLKQFGFTATVFLPTDYIGNGRPGIRGKQHLSWEEVRELHAQGITFGSHTCSHPQLREVGRDVLKDELARSHSAIETEAGACDGFCYPYKFPEQDGHFVTVLTDSIQSAGYDYCVSTRIGTTNTASDIFSLKRIPVNSGDDVPLFAAKLRGGYDWLAILQAGTKRLRRPASRSFAYRRSFQSNA